LCKALAQEGVDIDFIIPYTADHSDIDFMNVIPGHPQNVHVLHASGMAYQSFKFVGKDGSERKLDMHDQQRMYETEVGRLAMLKEYDIIHAHDWLTFRAGLRAKEVTGKPLIAHVHSIESDRAGRPGGGNPLVREIEEMGLTMAD